MKLRRVALLLLTLSLSACATAPAPTRLPSLGHNPTFSASGIPAPTGTPAAGSNGASPYTGPGLLIRLDTGNNELGFGQHAADYLTDGTIIRLNGKIMETNTLTVTGLAGLRALLAKDADLLTKDATIVPQVLPGKTLSGRGAIVDTFVLPRPDGSRYTINVPSTSSADAGAWAPDPTIERLNTLAQTLADPAALVGSDGLVTPTWAPYQPATMAVFVTFAQVDPFLGQEGLAPDLSTVGWPFAATPDTFGAPFQSPSGSARCAYLPTPEVQAAVATLTTVGAGFFERHISIGGVWRSNTIIWSAKSPSTAIGLAALSLLPEDAAASCSDALAY